jgi:hypothetical protein
MPSTERLQTSDPSQWPETDNPTATCLQRWEQDGAPSIFINYLGRDKYASSALDRDLSAWFGPEHIFQASRCIPHQAEWEVILIEAVRRCQVMLPVVEEGWAPKVMTGDHPWTIKEITMALDLGKPVLPVFFPWSIPRPQNNWDLLCLEGHQLPPEFDGRLDGIIGFRYDPTDVLTSLRIALNIRQVMPELALRPTGRALEVLGQIGEGLTAS